MKDLFDQGGASPYQIELLRIYSPYYNADEILKLVMKRWTKDDTSQIISDYQIWAQKGFLTLLRSAEAGDQLNALDYKTNKVLAAFLLQTLLEYLFTCIFAYLRQDPKTYSDYYAELSNDYGPLIEQTYLKVTSR